jgi:hypothetical protein
MLGWLLACPDRPILPMRSIPSKILAISLLLAPIASCGGGSSGSSAGGAVANFGLSVCSLGCSGSSFASNTHAANKDISFTFNDTVDPATVNFSSISIIDKTTGGTASGSFLVRGKKVIFRPTLIESSSGLQFGFLDGSTYRITVNDGSKTNVIRSKSGRANETFLTGDITISGVTDLVPGPPVLESITPDEFTPPASRSFDIEMVFNDVMLTRPLADPDTGLSSLITVSTFDTITGSILTIPGIFTAVVNRDTLKTTVMFTPIIPFPGSNDGQRVLRVSLSPQIADLAGNLLANPGIRVALLPDLVRVSGTLEENFDDQAKEDEDGSTLGLWASTPGTLDSGQDPLTGRHKGGGSGVLGRFAPETGLFTFDTDSTVITSDLLGEDVTITGGVFPFSKLDLNANVRLVGTGPNPFRLLTRGAVNVAGVIDASGADALNNQGKAFYTSERDNDATNGRFESDLGMIVDAGGNDPEALGGAGATGALGAGSGGDGGQSWYYQSVEFNFGNSTEYLNTFPAGWSLLIAGIGTLDMNRFENELKGDEFCGTNGEGVGGVAVSGFPLSGPVGNLLVDRANGSGMGSWCWPPTSNAVTNAVFSNGQLIKTHPTAFNGGGVPIAWAIESIHRSRGGGGGGYWTNGSRGTHFTAGGVDPLGDPLVAPLIDVDDFIFEYNDDGTGTNDYYKWDARAAGAASIPDAGGGAYTPPANAETLDPALGLLLGGSGGGGAGNSEHGSIQHRFSGGSPGQVGTYRSNPGAGGGAGGGALQLHAGSRLAVTGQILANGGHGGDSVFTLSLPFSDSNAILYGKPGDAGGGGGSGGAVLVQANGPLQLSPDAISVRGGRGGTGAAGNNGGAGGSGVVRFETSTGSETLATLQGFVAPDAAVDLAKIGSAGSANVAVSSADFSGAVADVTSSDGTVFNGNASGVLSRWYEPSAAVQEIVLTGWTINCEYRDGGGVQTLSFTHLAPPDPDTDPIWIALQAGWMEAGQSGLPEPTLLTQTAWAIPSVNGVTDGFNELNAGIIRALRYQLVFDHDVINGLIGGVAGGYFRVTDITFEFEGD